MNFFWVSVAVDTQESDFLGKPSLFGLAADASGNLFVSVAGYAWKSGAAGDPVDLKILKLAAGTRTKSVFGTLPYNGSYVQGPSGFSENGISTSTVYVPLFETQGHLYLHQASQSASCSGCMLRTSMTSWNPVSLPDTASITGSNNWTATGDRIYTAAGIGSVAASCPNFGIK